MYLLYRQKHGGRYGDGSVAAGCKGVGHDDILCAAVDDGAVVMLTITFRFPWWHVWFTYLYFILLSAAHCWVSKTLDIDNQSVN